MKFNGLATLLVSTAISVVDAEKWAWPNSQHRVDGKIQFNDNSELEQDAASSNNADFRQNETKQADEDSESSVSQFAPPSDTAGFYNRPPGGPETGRYPVQSLYHGQGLTTNRADRYPVNQDLIYPVNSYGHRVSYTDRRPQSPDWVGGYSDGTVDSLSNCRCLRTHNCVEPNTIAGACDVGKSLCCARRKSQRPHISENFQRPNNYPDPENGGQHGAPNVLVGPGGPTGIIGPSYGQDQGDSAGLLGPIEPTNAILVGPGGPTGIIGPNFGNRRPGNNKGVLVGPGGPTGIIGPTKRPVLVGPGGPTGIIGPASVIRPGHRNGILVGPGGPTGTIGPHRYNNNRGVLVGPGGPTGIIGPYGRNGRQLDETVTREEHRSRVKKGKNKIVKKKNGVKKDV